MKQEVKDTGTKDELFTGGEWETEYCLDGSIFVKSGEDYIAFIQGEDNVMTPEMEANAELLASAPAMYRALKDLKEKINEYFKNASDKTKIELADSILNANRIIKKATPNK